MKRQRRMRTLAVLLAFGLLLVLAACTPAESTPPIDCSEKAYACMTEDAYTDLQAKYADNFPKKYITWKQASGLGEIEFFSALDLSSSHTFAITDNSNSAFKLTVIYQPSSYETPIVDYSEAVSGGAPLISDSLKYIHNNTSAELIVKRNDVHYLYDKNGSISLIFWYINDIEIQFEEQSSEDSATDSLISRLLSTDEAVANAAFAEITEKLSK